MIHLLLDEAYRFGEYDYYSLHSGVDMLIKPVNDLVEYLRKLESMVIMIVRSYLLKTLGTWRRGWKNFL